MQVMNSIVLKHKGEDIQIDFGIPTTEEEKQEMFKLRYKVYRQKNLIIENNEIDIFL